MISKAKSSTGEHHPDCSCGFCIDEINERFANHVRVQAPKGESGESDIKPIIDFPFTGGENIKMETWFGDEYLGPSENKE